MVNTAPGVGLGGESITSRAAITSHTTTTTYTNVEHDAVGTHSQNSEYDYDYPALPASDPHFLTRYQRAGPLPAHWKALLPNSCRQQVERLFVRADGSCAGGSVVRALADAAGGGITMELAQDAAFILQFRTVRMVEYVQSWTDQQWCDRIHNDLRDQLWDERTTGREATERSVASERALLYELFSRSNYAIGAIFFPIVAAMLGIGVLLLITDLRHVHTIPQQQLYDFGTTMHARSMIIFNLYPKPVTGVKGGSKVGHFETVGRADGSGQPHHTLFARDDSCLCAFRHNAIKRSDSKTLDNLRIVVSQYDPPAASSVERSRDSEEVPTNAGTPQVVDGALNTRDDNENQRRRPAGPQRVSIRQRTQSSRLTHPGEDDVELHPVVRTRRSLAHALDTAAKRLDAAPVGGRRSSPTSLPAARVPSRRASRTAPAGDNPRPMVAAALLLSGGDRASTMGAQVLANVRGWVRVNTCHRRLARRVHVTAIPQWTLRCRTVLVNLAAALRAEPVDELAVVAHMCVLWALPGEMFAVPSRGGKQQRKNRINRIHSKLNDDQVVSRMLSELMDVMTITTHQAGQADVDGWAAVRLAVDEHSQPVKGAEQHHGASHPTDSRHVGSSHVSRTTVYEPSDVKAVQRAEHMLSIGDTYRAMQALTSTSETTDLNDRDERERLRQLHPPTSLPMPARPADAPEVMVDHEWMQAEMFASDTGASPGPSGYCSNYLSVLAADPHCVHAMAFFMQQIVNNRLPSVARTLLTTCTLVSLRKSGDGRRPVAMGDIFYRMASRYALQLVTLRAQALMAPHQYGAGQPDGCTQIVQSVQHLLTTVSASDSPGTSCSVTSRRPMACLSVDVANAFNSVDRAAVLRAVYSSPELAQCWRMVEFGYGSPSLLLMRCDDTVSDSEAFVESQTGVRQGDPLAGLLFSLTMHSTYDAVAKLTSGGLYAYQDDGHCVGTIAECWQAWEAIRPLLAQLGLKVNAAKCELTCFHLDTVRDSEDQSALAQFRHSGLAINDTCVRMLGCVVGRDCVAIADALSSDPRFLASELAAFRRLPAMRKQPAMLALQRLTGTVLTNRLRAMPPAATQRHAAEYDKKVMSAAHAIIRITGADGDKYDEQIRSSLSVGGFGLTSAADIAPAAYIAGVENTIRLSPALAAVWSGSVLLPPACGMAVAIDDSLERVTAMEAGLIARSGLAVMPEVSPSVLPSDAAAFVAHFRTIPPCPIQSATTHRVNTLCSIARVEEARRLGQGSVEAVARLLSLRQTGSSLWLQTIPTEAALRLTDEKWVWAARLRLGMPVPSVDDKCSGCNQHDAYVNNSWHSVCCVSRSGRTITDRHNQVLAVIARFCRLMLHNVRTEPADLCHDNDKRPDMQIDLPEKTILVDVTITHPTAKLWRKVAVTRSVESVGDARDKEKNNKYSEMAAALDVEFCSVVLYTHGGFHKSALRLVSDLVAAFDPATCLISRDEYRTALLQQIAIAVQRGTADIMIRDAMRIRGSVCGRLGRRHLAARRRAEAAREYRRQQLQQRRNQPQQRLRCDGRAGMDGLGNHSDENMVIAEVPVALHTSTTPVQAVVGDDTAVTAPSNVVAGETATSASVLAYSRGLVRAIVIAGARDTVMMDDATVGGVVQHDAMDDSGVEDVADGGFGEVAGAAEELAEMDGEWGGSGGATDVYMAGDSLVTRVSSVRSE